MRRNILAILVTLSICCSSANVLAAVNMRSNPFLEMMLTMMEMMGFIDRDNDAYNQPYPSYNHLLNKQNSTYGNPWQSWGQVFAMQQMLNGANPSFSGTQGLLPGLGMAPFNPAMQGMNVMPGMTGSGAAIPYLPQYFNQSQAGNLPYKSHWIEGKWIANDGMIMEVWQGQFKMYYRHAPDQVREGLIRLKDQWLAIYEQSQQFSRQYEFAYDDDRLALRDTDGNLMLFKRLTDWLNPLQY